jgi:hypothetical protein
MTGYHMEMIKRLPKKCDYLGKYLITKSNF